MVGQDLCYVGHCIEYSYLLKSWYYMGFSPYRIQSHFFEMALSLHLFLNSNVELLQNKVDYWKNFIGRDITFDVNLLQDNLISALPI